MEGSPESSVPSKIALYSIHRMFWIKFRPIDDTQAVLDDAISVGKQPLRGQRVLDDRAQREARRVFQVGQDRDRRAVFRV